MSKKNSNVQNLKSTLINNKKIFKIFSSFKSKLEKSIGKKSFAVAVSGGPDSLALAALSQLYKYENKNKIFFLLIDHGIRKKSESEAKSVKRLLKKNKISLKILINKEKIYKDIQNSARKIRYKLLSNFCYEKKCRFLLTGHHSDDQVETFLIRLSRGSGIQGLSSMSNISNLSKKVKLLRPLLDTKKKDLVVIAKKVFKKIIHDPSNKDQKYLRTKIRRLTKILEKNGISHEQIIRSINNLSSSKDTLNKYLNHVVSECLTKKHNEVRIDLKKLFLETHEIRFKVISYGIKNLSKSYYPPRTKKITNLIKSFSLKKNTKHTLGGCILEQFNSNLIIYKERAKKKPKKR